VSALPATSPGRVLWPYPSGLRGQKWLA